jgi:hypothetical protein
VIIIPLSARINGELVIAPDLSDTDWEKLKIQHKQGLLVIMPCCGQNGHLRVSPNALKHFYHAKKSQYCGGEPETPEHEQMKYRIYQICKEKGWTTQPEYPSPTNDWRADVFATNGARKIAFEVQLSKISQEELQNRENKYVRDGIESYWLLNEFLNLEPYDRPDQDEQEHICIENHLDLGEFLLSREKLYFFKKGIRTIGVNLPTNSLYTSYDTSILLSDWINNVLLGNYFSYLSGFKEYHSRKIKLRSLARPILEEIADIEQDYFEYRFKFKRIYAIFKNNMWEDYPDIKQEIDLMYATLDELKTAIWKDVLTKKNGFYWGTYYDSSDDTYLKIKLNSEQQISSISEQGKSLQNIRNKLVSLYTTVEERVQKKGNGGNYYKKHIENGKITKIIYDRNSKFGKIESVFVPSEKISSPLPKKVPMPFQKEVLFEFIPVLPMLTLISEAGLKYQNPAGCKWMIKEEDASEFERKGYGRICIP